METADLRRPALVGWSFVELIIGLYLEKYGREPFSVALNATWDRSVPSSGRRGDSTWGEILSIKKRRTNKALSDQEIWWKIRYLDPHAKRSDSVVIITVLAILAIVGVVVALLYSRGL